MTFVIARLTIPLHYYDEQHELRYGWNQKCRAGFTMTVFHNDLDQSGTSRVILADETQGQ